VVSVVKMAIVLEECITEEMRSFFFLWEKGLNAKYIHKEMFILFTVGSVCHVKRFTTG
jgi:hypothetical protein